MAFNLHQFERLDMAGKMDRGAARAFRAVVHGRVKGVRFRYCKIREATRLGALLQSVGLDQMALRAGTIASRWSSRPERASEPGRGIRRIPNRSS